MYKTLFWIVLGIAIFKSGGAFVPRVEYLEDRVETLYNMIIDNKNEQDKQINQLKDLTNKRWYRTN